MNKKSHMHRLTTFGLLCAALAGGLLALGCGQTTQDATPPAENTAQAPGWTVTPVEAAPATTAEAAEEGEGTAAAEISPVDAEMMAVDTYLAWFYLQEHYKKLSRSSPELERAFLRKEAELRKTTPPVPIGDHFEALAVDWQLQNASGNEEGDSGKMLAKVLIRKVKPLELKSDERVQLFLRIVPDRAHHARFEAKRRDGIDFGLPVATDNEAWPEGEIRLIKRDVEAPIVPYNVFVFANIFSSDGEFIERLGGGKGLGNLGWHVGLPDDDLPTGGIAENKE